MEISVVVMGLVVVAVIAVLVTQSTIVIRALKGLAVKQGGVFNFTGTVQAAVDGIPYTCRYVPSGKNSPPKMIVQVSCSSPGQLTVTRESRIDSFFKKIGFSAEVQTGDKEFDDAFYVLTDTPGFASAYLRGPSRCRAVENCFGAGSTYVKLDGKNVSAQLSPFHANNPEHQERVLACARHLAVLSKDIPVSFESDSLFGAPQAKAKRAIVLTAAVGSFNLGFVSLIWAQQYPVLDAGPLFFKSLKTSVPVLLAVLFLAAMLLRGRSSSHRDFFISVFMLIPGLILLGFGSAGVLNGRNDMTENQDHFVRVLSKYKTHSKNSTTYHALIESWRHGRSQEHVTVPWREYRSIAPGQSRMRVTTRRGFLGFEWIVSRQASEG